MFRPALILVTVLALGSCADQAPSSSAAGLNVGDDAPAFELPAADGGRAELDEYVGSGPVLLYFSMGPG
jgi:hypothetical protein